MHTSSVQASPSAGQTVASVAAIAAILVAALAIVGLGWSIPLRLRKMRHERQLRIRGVDATHDEPST